MLDELKRRIKRLTGSHESEKVDGEAGIAELGHREYVGGHWDEIGKLQFDFLVAQGLQPSHCFLDIACGSLRAGTYLIGYLEAGHYLGIDKEQQLIRLGIERELPPGVYRDKRPEFVVSDRFEFERFSRKPHFSIAQSLFTHLTTDDMMLCMTNLRRFVDSGHICFVTFFEGSSSRNPQVSHSHAVFTYSVDEMARLGEDAGWASTYIGAWKHPRNQMMIKYVAS